MLFQSKRILASLQELILVLISFAISVFVLIIGFDYNLFTEAFRTEIGTHTYYSASIYFLPIFMLLTFLIFVIKQAAFRRTSTFSNMIAILSGAIFIVAMAYLNHFLKPFSRADAFAWPGHPPGTAISSEENMVEGTKAITTVMNLGISLQILVAITLIYLVYKLIKSRSNG